MNYKLIYEQLVTRGQERPELEGYKERHHIIPRCMGGGDEEENLVDLTPEEHFLAHQLLVKMHPGNIRLVRACDVMAKDTKKNKYWRRNKMYGWLRRRLHVPKVTITCEYCECTFKALECQKRRFCSQDCKKKSQENKTALCCKGCKKDFEVLPNKAKTRQYCSPACSSKSQQKRDTKKCLCCGKLIVGQPNVIKKRKYCSKECTDSSRVGVSKPPTRFAPTISKPCKQCGDLIYGKPGVLKQKTFCSVKCGALSRRVKNTHCD